MDQNLPASSNNTPTSTLPIEVNHAKKDGSGITCGITIISTVSLFLTLLGYGVSLAVETIFGMPHQTVYSSVLDLIGLSVYALLSMVLGLGDIAWWPLFDQVWPTSLIATAGMFILMCSTIYLKHRSDRASARTRRFWQFFRWPNNGDSTTRLVGKGTIGSIAFGAVVFITPFVIMVALMAGIFLLSVVPILGMQLGSHYFERYVVRPTMCMPVRSSAALIQAWSAPRNKNGSTASTATCVGLLKDGTQIAAGRVVVSTPATIVLFDPASGAVRRIPIGEVTVLPIEALGSR